MARIYTYALDAAINDADKLIGTDADNNNQTKNFSLLGIAEYVIDTFIDPDASDFQIPVFNQDGIRITGSIMSQDSSPSNGTAGTQITIDGNLLVNQNATVYLNLSVSGESYLLGNVYLGTTQSDTIKQRGTLELLAQIKDSSGTLGNNEQVLVSDALGKLHWENYQGTGLEYQSAWNPATNTPDLTAIPLTGDNTGKYWVASVEGNTDLGGITDWNPGDWAIVSQDNDDNVFWDKIDNSGIDGVGATNYISKWTGPKTLGSSGFYQVNAPVLEDGAVGLNTTKLSSFYGEYPDLRVASRSLNDPGVLDLFRPDGDVQAGDRVGILQYSLDDDTRYAVAQIEVKTIGDSGSGNTGGGKFCIKTSANTPGAQVTDRLCIDNTEAAFQVPINVTSTSQSSFAGQVTIPETPIDPTDAASKAYVDAQSGGGGSYLTFTRTFTGNELVNAFNGNPSDSINLVSVPNNKIAIVIEAVIIIKAASTGTTNYNANVNLYVQPSGANSVWGAIVDSTSLNASTDFVQFSTESGANTALSTAGGAGADIVLGSGGSPCSITQGDRDVLLSVTYRLLDI